MRRIYLDHHATTPCDPRVLSVMWPYFNEHFGNASSPHHVFGREAREAVERARGHVAETLGTDPRGIVFTSGATEALNLALRGLFAAGDGRRRILVGATEHAAVRDTARDLVRAGASVEFLPVDGEGRIDPDHVARRLRDVAHETALVAVMLANNEVGTIAPLEAIGARCAAFDVPLVVDAVQGIGHVPWFQASLPGLVATVISGHKIGGPKGVGALWLRPRPPVLLAPQMTGGGQERGLRPGTVAVPLVVGLGEASRLAGNEGTQRIGVLRALRDRLWHGLKAALGDGVVRNSPSDGLAHNLHVSFPGIESRALMEHLPNLAFSAGSACHAGSGQPSHVLEAMGLAPARSLSAARFAVAATTTEDDVDTAVAWLADAVRKLSVQRT
jgi:cysteine desulfurase